MGVLGRDPIVRRASMVPRRRSLIAALGVSVAVIGVLGTAVVAKFGSSYTHPCETCMRSARIDPKWVPTYTTTSTVERAQVDAYYP